MRTRADRGAQSRDDEAEEAVMEEREEEEEAVLFTTNATQPPGKAWGSRHRTSNAAHPAPRGKNRDDPKQW